MRDSIYRFTLDVHDVSSQVQIVAKKNDNARKIYITLMEYGKPYTVEGGCHAVMMIKKPDGNILFNDCYFINTGSVIAYDFTWQTTSISGLCECEVRLYSKDDELITSPRFTILVNDLVYDDGQIESTSEYSALTKAMSDMTEVKEGISYIKGNMDAVLEAKADVIALKEDTEVLKNETSALKNETTGIKDETVIIKEETNAIKDLAYAATHEAEEFAQFAETSASNAENAKQYIIDHRDELKGDKGDVGEPGVIWKTTEPQGAERVPVWINPDADFTPIPVGPGGADIDDDVIATDKTWSSSKINSFKSEFVTPDNVKTINGNSIIGQGNIVIQGGSGGGNTINVSDTEPTDGSEYWFDPQGDVSTLDTFHWIPVETYGAVGDGVTDDTEAIQMAITQASWLGAGVFLGGGKTYKISSPLHITKNARLAGAGKKSTTILNTNNNDYAVCLESFNGEISNLTIKSAYGLFCGLSASKRTLFTNAKRLCITGSNEIDYGKYENGDTDIAGGCVRGITVSKGTGYNRFDDIEIKTAVHYDSKGNHHDITDLYPDIADPDMKICGIYLGGSAGFAGVNYVYLTACMVEPYRGHRREENTSALQIEDSNYTFVDKCDFVGHDNGIELNTAKFTYVSNTTIFNNNKAVYGDARNGGLVRNFKMVNTGIAGNGYFLYTEPITSTSYIYQYMEFNMVDINADVNGNFAGLVCNNCERLVLDCLVHGIKADTEVSREFNNCSFGRYQSIYKEIKVSATTTKTGSITVGSFKSLLPIKPIQQIVNMNNSNPATLTYTCTNNGNGTVTIDYEVSNGTLDGAIMS